jgi:hypothetical protein
MAFVEYILVALLGSIGAAPAGAPRSPVTRTLDSDFIAQPSGGASVEGHFSLTTGMTGQATSGSPGKQTGGKKPMHRSARRQHRKSGKPTGGAGNANAKRKVKG